MRNNVNYYKIDTRLTARLSNNTAYYNREYAVINAAMTGGGVRVCVSTLPLYKEMGVEHHDHPSSSIRLFACCFAKTSNKVM